MDIRELSKGEDGKLEGDKGENSQLDAKGVRGRSMISVQQTFLKLSGFFMIPHGNQIPGMGVQTNKTKKYQNCSRPI